MRRRTLLLFLPAGLILVLAAILAWLLNTESGARWLWQRAVAAVPISLQAQGMEGTLNSGLRFTRLQVSNDSMQAELSGLEFRLSFGLLPPSVHIEPLQAEQLRLKQLGRASQESPVPLADTLSGLALPIPVRVERLQLQRFEWHAAGDAPVFVAEGLRLSAFWYRELELEDARMRALQADWRLGGELQLAQPFGSRWQLQLNGDEGSDWPASLSLTARGDFSELPFEVRVENPEARISGVLQDLDQVPRWQVQLEAPGVSWPLGVQAKAPLSAPPSAPPSAQHSAPTAAQPPGLAWQLRNLTADSQGSVEDYQLSLAAEVAGENLPEGPLELLLSGNAGGAQINLMRLVTAEGSITAEGTLDWQAGFSAALDVRLSELDPQRWLAAWPEAARAAGQVQVQLDDSSISARDLKLELAAGDQAATLTGHADFRWDSSEFDSSLQWRNLKWPLAGDSPTLMSESGQVELAGSLDNWQAELQGLLRSPDLPQGRLDLSLAGSGDSLKATINPSELLGGSAEGDATLSWGDSIDWHARLKLRELQLAPLVPEYPAIVSGQLEVSAQAGSESYAIRLQQLSGSLNRLRLQANGELHVAGDRITAQQLRIESGTARIDLDGDLRGASGLDFSLNAPRLGELVPDAQGSVQGRGNLRLTNAAPRVQISLSGEGLALGENRIGRVVARSGAQAGDLEVQISEAFLAGREVAELRADLDGDELLRNLQVSATVDQTRLLARLDGGMVDWSEPLGKGWQGRVEALQAEKPDLGMIKLQHAAALKVSSQRAEWGPACLDGQRGGSVCSEGQWDKRSGSAGSAELSNLSLDLLRLFVQPAWSFTHRLSGELRWDQPLRRPASADVKLTLSEGELVLEGDEPFITTGPGRLQFRLDQGKLDSGLLEIPIPGSGGINARFSIDQLNAGTDAAVEADVRVQLRDLSPLEILIPQFDSVAGQLEGDLRVSGTIADPRLTGHATLVRGHLEQPAAGLVLSEIQLAGAVYQDGRTELNGSFRAGEGSGRLKALVRFEDFLNPQVQLSVNGENLLLVNVPDLRLLADPNLSVEWQGDQVRLDGEITVPSARLSPRFLPSSSATESADLVIVSAQAEAPVAERDPAPLQVSGQVALKLGKDVNVSLDKATVHIEGLSVFVWDGPVLPVADGGFDLAGNILAYGQLLNISEGRVSFPRIPVDNPNLNIRAEREIFGNAQVRRAGVHITGTLRRPLLETYTFPPTNKERALTLLLTGSDFNYEQGVGAVEVGMYVAPKLFISYGIGLFEDQNVISARYDLGKGFGVKATSGQRETGVDISYTIEH